VKAVEDGDNYFGSLKCGEFIDWLRNDYNFKKCFASWIFQAV
jgi:uncharacterized protein YpiB (UPF0302 family)